MLSAALVRPALASLLSSPEQYGALARYAFEHYSALSLLPLLAHGLLAPSQKPVYYRAIAQPLRLFKPPGRQPDFPQMCIRD